MTSVTRATIAALEAPSATRLDHVVRRVRLLLLVIAASITAWLGLGWARDHGPLTPDAAYGGRALTFTAPGGPLQARLFAGSRFSPGGDLVVVLHGDAPDARPGYQYRLAAIAAAAMPDAAFVAVLRPGYTDPTGRRSAGRRGLTVGDNYTADRIDAVAAAIAGARAQTQAGRVLLVGHSGGAALAALLLARRPETAHRAVLVACPCDLAAWRQHMARMRLDPLFLIPTASLDPRAMASKIPSDARISLIVGADDDVAPPGLSRAFAAVLGERATVRIIPGGHEIFDRPEVLSAIAQMRAAR